MLITCSSCTNKFNTYFHFQTIPDLVTGLRDMANVVAEQTKVTGAYGAAFLDCPDCKF